MSGTTLIIAPSEGVAAEYRRHLMRAPNQSNTERVNVVVWQSLTGHRGDRVIVLPFRTDSVREREAFDRMLAESAPCRVAPGGELIVL